MAAKPLRMALGLLSSSAKEHIEHGLGPLRSMAARGLYLLAHLLRVRRSYRVPAFRTLMRLHSIGFSARVEKDIERDIKRADAAERSGVSTGLWDTYDATTQSAVAAFTERSAENRLRILGARVLVVKTARPNERGVLFVDYSYVFPLLAGLFDLRAIAERYFIVLEPSWRDACSPEILAYSRLDAPVFVQTIEPHDHRLFAALRSNLQVIPIAANYWVDYRTSSITTTERRDIDVIMVASWSRIKRHWRVFKTLRRLRRQGHRLRVALVGYQQDLSRAEIENQARYFDVADQIEMFEGLSQDGVSSLLWRSKVHVLWSRTECANRAIIEAMLADVPVLVREGLTYGFHYPYINAQTGRFVREADLGQAILETVRSAKDYSPRQWVLDHMTCQQATAAVEEAVRLTAAQLGERWSEGLV